MKEELRYFLLRLAGLLLLIYLTFGWILGITIARNNDMSPRISAGDLVLYYRLEKHPKVGDIAVYSKDKSICIHRVFATGGEEVEITQGNGLRRNGHLVLEPDIFYKTPRYEGDVEYPLKLEENEYFMLGDFREGAKDSRYSGPAEQEEIKGKVITILRRTNL